MMGYITVPKSVAKEMIDIAKEIGFQKNDIFDVLGCMTWENEMRSILLPKLLE